MPKYFGPVRPTTSAANRPAFPLGVPPILPDLEPEGYPEAPYPGDLTAGDGASRDFRPNPLGSYSTNVPQPDNTVPPSKASGDGMNGMAG